MDAEQIPTTYFVTATHRSKTLASQNGIPRLTVKIFFDWNRSFTYRDIQHKICELKNSAVQHGGDADININKLIYK